MQIMLQLFQLHFRNIENIKKSCNVPEDRLVSDKIHFYRYRRVGVKKLFNMIIFFGCVYAMDQVINEHISIPGQFE